MQEQNPTTAIIIPSSMVKAVEKAMRNPNDSHEIRALELASKKAHKPLGSRGGLSFIRGVSSDKNSPVAVVMDPDKTHPNAPRVLVAFTTLGIATAAYKGQKIGPFQEAAKEIRESFNGHKLTTDSGAINPPPGCKTYLSGSRLMV